MSSAPVVSIPQRVRELYRYITGVGYTEATLKTLGLTNTPWKGSAERNLLPSKVDASSALFALIQLFFFGEEIGCASVEATLPGSIIDGMLSVGMVLRESDSFVPACMLVHFGDLLIACDSVRRARSGQLGDLVLGVNRPTQILGNCIIHIEKAEAILDLGTGCGTLAFGVASNATEILGTDINERALAFAKFNAALNDITNFEVLAGDRFKPVEGKTFDLIISSPPFFLTPSSKLLFTDNPFLLDSFVESLAQQAPAFLKDGGYFQMLCEWVQFGSKPWQERIRGWFENSGCDVLILTDYEISPADYTLQRSLESSALHGESGPDAVTDHLKYFEERDVQKIFGGLITIRRNPAPLTDQPRLDNWFLVDETGGRPTTPIGEQLLDRFASQDILASGDDNRLLATKPRLIKDVVLVQESVQENRTWNSKIIFLGRRSGLTRRLAFNAEIADIVADWDGTQDLDFLVTVFARKKGAQEAGSSRLLEPGQEAERTKSDFLNNQGTRPSLRPPRQPLLSCKVWPSSKPL